MTLLQIREALENSWNVDTTYCIDKFDHKNPSAGQCLVSSLVVQYFLGGTLIEATVKEPGKRNTGHYWLKLNGIDIDFTWHQFPVGTKIIKKNTIARKRMLYGKVKKRYNILLGRVESYLNKNL